MFFPRSVGIHPQITYMWSRPSSPQLKHWNLQKGIQQVHHHMPSWAMVFLPFHAWREVVVILACLWWHLLWCPQLVHHYPDKFNILADEYVEAAPEGSHCHQGICECCGQIISNHGHDLNRGYKPTSPQYQLSSGRDSIPGGSDKLIQFGHDGDVAEVCRYDKNSNLIERFWWPVAPACNLITAGFFWTSQPSAITTCKNKKHNMVYWIYYDQKSFLIP